MVADPSARQLFAVLWSVGVATIYALAGQHAAALMILGVLLVVLVTALIREVRNRRWDARVARWDRPEVWLILDAVRDREHRRQQSEQAWRQLSATLAGIAAAVTSAIPTLRDAAEGVVAAFDGRFLGFGDRLIAAEPPAREEVRWL